MKLFYFTVLALFSVTAYSQKTKFGVNAGATYAFYRGNWFVDDTSGSLNFIVGLKAEYEFNNQFSILGNLNYTRKSIKSYEPVYPGWDDGVIIIGEEPNMIKASTIFQYITLPVMAKMYLWGAKKLYMNGGFYFAHLIDVTNYFDGEPTDLNFNSAFKKADAGLVLGIGYPIKINKDHDINVELRDEYSLSNVGDETAQVFSPTKSHTPMLILIWDF
jgi:hypothetical protein